VRQGFGLRIAVAFGLALHGPEKGKAQSEVQGLDDHEAAEK
jgi:hypothetical protein